MSADAGGSAAAAASGGDGEGEGADGEKTAFPILLHEIVSDPSTDDCIHWLSCGTRFMISDKKKFAKEVLPRFYGHAKFTSFTRRLKRWSFTRVPSGPFMGAYYNANFRRGEPELATRVRYDHPTPLSGAAMQLNKAKLEAIGAAGLPGLGLGGGLFNPLLGQMALSNEDREVLLRQMNMMNAGNAMGMGMHGLLGQQGMGAVGNPNLEALYRAMSQNNAMGGQQGNMAATNQSVALQMAMAQEMIQQQQRQQGGMGNLNPMDQARLLAQQQFGNQNMNDFFNQGQQGNAGGNQANQGQQGSGGGNTPEDQSLLAAMFLDRLNKQNQGQQQGQAGNAGLNANFAGSSMPSLASLTATSSLASNINQGGGSGQGLAGLIQQSQNNNSGGSLSVHHLQGQGSNASLTTMPGGRSNANNSASNANAGFQLNFNSPSGLMPGAAAGMGALGNAMMGNNMNNNPAAMNALLADYLRRTSGAPSGDGDKNDDGPTQASC